MSDINFFHSLHSEVLSCQSGIVNLQHQPGIVLCGNTYLEKKERKKVRGFLSTYNCTAPLFIVPDSGATGFLVICMTVFFTPDLHSTGLVVNCGIT